MNYNPELAKEYEGKLKELHFLPANEKVVGVNIGQYRTSGQVYWWPVEIELDSGYVRKYIMKAPHDTFGDNIPLFNQRRVRYSEMLRNASIPVPKSGIYDEGTLVQEFVEGTPLDVSLKSATPEQKQSLLLQKREVAEKCRELGLILMDDGNTANFIVNEEGRVTLVDLDFIEVK